MNETRFARVGAATVAALALWVTQWIPSLVLLAVVWPLSGFSVKPVPVGLFYLVAPGWVVACAAYGLWVAYAPQAEGPVVRYGAAAIVYCVLGSALTVAFEGRPLSDLGPALLAAVFPVGQFWAALFPAVVRRVDFAGRLSRHAGRA